MIEQMTTSVMFTVISKVRRKFLLNKLAHVTLILEDFFSLYSLYNPWHLMRQIKYRYYGIIIGPILFKDLSS